MHCFVVVVVVLVASGDGQIDEIISLEFWFLTFMLLLEATAATIHVPFSLANLSDVIIICVCNFDNDMWHRWYSRIDDDALVHFSAISPQIGFRCVCRNIVQMQFRMENVVLNAIWFVWTSRGRQWHGTAQRHSVEMFEKLWLENYLRTPKRHQSVICICTIFFFISISRKPSRMQCMCVCALRTSITKRENIRWNNLE